MALFANSLRCNGASAAEGRPSVARLAVVTAARDPYRTRNAVQFGVEKTYAASRRVISANASCPFSVNE